MKKDNFNLLIIIILIVSVIISCCNNKEKYNIETETLTETIIIEIPKTDSIYIDNPIIPYVNQDSLDRVELIRDSIQFRKITKKINGGYNGFADRYAMWLRARNLLKNKE